MQWGTQWCLDFMHNPSFTITFSLDLEWWPLCFPAGPVEYLRNIIIQGRQTGL